jgi:hypothetical protein
MTSAGGSLPIICSPRTASTMVERTITAAPVPRAIQTATASHVRVLRMTPNGLTLTGAGRTRKEYRTWDHDAAVGVRCSVELDDGSRPGSRYSAPPMAR